MNNFLYIFLLFVFKSLIAILYYHFVTPKRVQSYPNKDVNVLTKILVFAAIHSPDHGKATVDECQKCNEGSYCNTTGQTAMTGKCSAGYYCLRGATSPKPNNGSTGGPCKKGHSCPDGRYMNPCAIGIFAHFQN